MKMITKYAAILTIFIFIMVMSACSVSSPHERLLSHMEAIINMLYENREDIPKAASEVKAYVESNIDEIKTLVNESLADGTNPILTDSLYEERLTKMIQKHSELETGYVLLIKDPSVTEALAPLSEVFEASKAAQAKKEE